MFFSRPYIRDIEATEIRQDSRKVNEAKIKLVEINRRIYNLVESLAEMSGGAIEVVNKVINKEYEQREKILKELENAMLEQKAQDRSSVDFDDFIDNWDTFDIEKKKGIARIFIKSVIVTDDEIVPVFK